MITNKFYGIREVITAMIVAAVLFVGASMTYAQTSTFTPPNGYNQVGSSGIYYNSSNNSYYNPMTGQYSNLQPLGAAARDASGAYIIPPGYSQSGTSGYYFNSSSGYYYDPSTGFYSTSAPMNTGVTASMAQNYIVPGTFTPGVPNTGAGGDATLTFGLLALLGIAAISGAVALSRRIS